MHLREVEGRKGFKEYAGKSVRFYIKKVAGEDSLYLVSEFRKVVRGYLLFVSQVDLRATGLDERKIFKDGRSRSKYANILQIYNYYGPEKLGASRKVFDDIANVKQEIYRLYVKNA